LAQASYVHLSVLAGEESGLALGRGRHGFHVLCLAGQAVDALNQHLDNGRSAVMPAFQENPARCPAYHGGHRYQHPTKKELVWTAKGQKPNWVRELEAEGKRPVEVPVEAA